MVGSSMMMASFGFMIYAISPVYSNSELEKSEMNNEIKLSSPVGTNGVIIGDNALFVDGGYVYAFYKDGYWKDASNWGKYKLP